MFNSKPMRHALTVYLTVRVLLSFVGYFASTTYPEVKALSAGGFEKVFHSPWFEHIAGVWERADSLWFFHIARDGYTGDSDAAFFPFYPLLISILHKVSFLPWIACGLIISNLSLIFAFYFLYRLCEMEYGVKVAERAVWYLALFPGSAFLFAAYSEALYLMLALAALFCCRLEKWGFMNLCISFLCLTRNTGVVILLPIAIMMYPQGFRRIQLTLKSLFIFCMVPVTLFGFLLFWYFKTGDPFAFILKQQGWGREPMFPLYTLWEGFRQAWLFGNSPPGGFYVLDAFVVFVIMVFGIVGIRKLPSAYSTFLFLSLIPPLCAPYSGRMLMSFVRFVTVLFPAFITMAILTENSKVDHAIRVFSSGLLALVAALFVTSLNMF